MEIKPDSQRDMDISPSKENRTVQNDLQNNTNIQNSVDIILDVEDSMDEKGNLLNVGEDLELDIIECTNNCDDQLAESNGQESSETSSSFDGSDNNHENAMGPDDQGVESIFREHPLPTFNDMPNGLFGIKRKKVADEWRRFVRQIMWRCKWIEQKVREFRYQAQKYDKELRYYDLNKQFELEKVKLGGLDSKSLPVSCSPRRMKIMKRKKRKRVEEKTNIRSYMLHHNMFSYYESRKPVVLDARMHTVLDNRTKRTEDEIGLDDLDDLCPHPELKALDDCMENLIRKIEEIRSQSKKLKRRIMKAVNEDCGKFLPSHKPATPEKGNVMHVQTTVASSEHTKDNLIPQTLAANHEKVTPLRGMMIQNKKQPLIRSTFVDVKDESERNDEVAEEELNYFEKVINEVTRRVLPEEPNANRPVTRSIAGKRKASSISGTNARTRLAAQRRKTSG